jgi:multidrug efflux pump subunit AcrA (membrane-fusion protein)
LKKQIAYLASQSQGNLALSAKLEDDYIIKSEMDGLVYSLNKTEGDLVSPQQPIAVIGNASEFVLSMQVDEYDIFKIKNGFTVIVSLDSYKNEVFEAVVTKVYPIMNERTKTFIVEAEFVKTPKLLYPNISFEANIVIDKKDKALLIPRNCLVNDSFVMKSDGEKVLVKTGLKDYQQIEILSGIDLNDELTVPKP